MPLSLLGKAKGHVSPLFTQQRQGPCMAAMAPAPAPVRPCQLPEPWGVAPLPGDKGQACRNTPVDCSASKAHSLGWPSDSPPPQAHTCLPMSLSSGPAPRPHCRWATWILGLWGSMGRGEGLALPPPRPQSLGKATCLEPWGKKEVWPVLLPNPFGCRL